MECCLAILNSYGGPGDDLSDRDSEDSKISDEEPDGVKDSIQNQEHNERPISSKNEEAFSTMDSTEERVRVEKTDGDRKSTRLNSSHANISYAVFCLKKKKKNKKKKKKKK